MNQYDLLVIGAGSGGIRAARTSARLGAKVGVVEQSDLGGTCVNVGCIPKKLFVYASHYGEMFAHSRGFGWQSDLAQFDWQQLRDNKDSELKRLHQVYAQGLAQANVDLLTGQAYILNPHQVQVSGQVYKTHSLLIATGGQPYIPQIEGREWIWSSNDIFALPTLPQRIVVVGGGYIAVEFSGIFHGWGVDTTLVHRGSSLLRGFDRQLGEWLLSSMVQKKIHCHVNRQVKSVCKSGNALVVHLDDQTQLHTDGVLYATGRQPSTAQLGLENTAVQLSAQGHIVVDEHYASTEPNIYAVGDVIGRKALTPVAIREGEILAHRLFGTVSLSPLNYSNIPTAVFSQPPIGTVGISEAEAVENGHKVRVYQSQFTPLKHQLSGANECAYMKLVVDTQTDKVLGVHILAEDAAEIIQGFAVALQTGATKKDFDQTVALHPTTAEELVTMR